MVVIWTLDIFGEEDENEDIWMNALLMWLGMEIFHLSIIGW